jgi:hypothetical protein
MAIYTPVEKLRRASWTADRFRDFGLWPVNLIRDMPKRSGRLAGLLMTTTGLSDVRLLLYWLFICGSYLFDLFGGPEIIQFFLRASSKARPLSVEEIQAIKTVLSPQSIRLGDVRVASRGILSLVFRLNKNRAFATWHTVNLPEKRVEDIPLIVHELIHIYQYERVGSLYIGQGLWAQVRQGRGAYDYGGADGLKADRAAGKHLSDYNREQQCQIVQDYFSFLQATGNVDAFSPYISELKNGLL